MLKLQRGEVVRRARSHVLPFDGTHPGTGRAGSTSSSTATVKELGGLSEILLIDRGVVIVDEESKPSTPSAAPASLRSGSESMR